MERAKRGRGVALAVLGVAHLTLSGPVVAQETGNVSTGRGFFVGGGLLGGQLGWPGGDGLTLNVGEAIDTRTIPNAGATITVRDGALVDGSRAGEGKAVRTAPLPRTQGAAALTMHLGYAFSPRAALILSAEVVTSVDDGFGTTMGGVVLRYWPASRLWIEAGPASGDMSYGYDLNVVEEFTGTGYGARAALGLTVVERPRWALDVVGRVGTLRFDGFEARSFSVGVVGRTRPR